MDGLAQSKTLVELLLARAAHNPAKISYTFLADGEQATAQLTYTELNQRAQAIGALLQNLCQPGARVLLLYPPGLDYITAFWGCLIAGVIAVPAYPPRANRVDSRLQAIIRDAGATVALTTDAILQNITARFAVTPELTTLHWQSTDQLDLTLAAHWRDPGVRAEQLALLQYTSGSTGNPKGVMVSHANLLHNLALAERRFQFAAHRSFFSWLPLYHDMGLIGGLLQPLYSGASALLMAPVTFLQQPLRWLQIISAYRVAIIGAPNFAYELCVQSITPEQRTGLDLSMVSCAICGGEPLRAATVQRFIDTFASCGFQPTAFFPSYGMAETTLLIAAKAPQAQPTICHLASATLTQGRVLAAAPEQAGTQALVSCGQPVAGYQVVIVNPETQTPAQPDQVGEIWVAGPSVAQGYWNQADATAQTFQAHLADSAEGPFLRTGDLGFFHQGELFIAGRRKDLIIIRGRNYHPQDIEQTVEGCHPALRLSGCAAFTVEGAATEQLVIVAEVERSHLRNLPGDAVLDAIRRAVATEHQVQVSAIQLLKPMHLPKTSSGKVQRYLCRAKFLEQNFETVGEWRLPTPAPSGDAVEPATPIPLHNDLYRAPGWRLAETKAAAPSATVDAERERSRTCADDLIQWLRSYAAERLNSYLIDERRTIPPYVVLDLGNRGLLGLQAPQAYGGIALSHTDSLRITEQLGAIDQALALFIGLHNCLGLRPILNSATPTLRDELAPLLATGRELAAFALTEPGAGSNPQALATCATPVGDGWRLTGEKSWSGSAAWAGVINVFAQQLDSAGRSLGISGFVLRQGTPGLRQGPEALTMGMRGMVHNTVYLTEAAVGPAQLLGQAGAGMAVAHDTLMYGRLGLAAMSLGGMKRCAQLMARYAERRSVATGPLLHHPVTLLRLSELNAAIAAVESLICRVAQLLDAGVTLPPELYAVCKIAGPEFFWRATDQLVQLLGGRGYIESNGVPQLLRDARVLRIFEGPTETLNHFLGARAIHSPGPLHAFLHDHFGAGRLADRWQTAIGEIHSRINRATPPGATTTAAMQWAYALGGEATSWTVLVAALQWAEQQAATPARQPAIAWAQAQLEQKLAQAVAQPFAPWMQLDPGSLREQIATYQTTIGDLEQTLAGAHYELDPWLRQTMGAARPAAGQPTTVPPPPPVAVEEQNLQSSPADPSDPTVISAYLQRWVAKTLGLASGQIDPQQPLLGLGIDSLLAMELRNQVQRDWQVEIPVSFLLDSATTASLAAFVAAQQPAAAQSPLTAATPSPSHLTGVDFLPPPRPEGARPQSGGRTEASSTSDRLPPQGLSWKDGEGWGGVAQSLPPEAPSHQPTAPLRAKRIRGTL